MTEAYMMGFCKAAEEHGIDPRALMKFAQAQTTPKYQTGGWAPDVVTKIPRNKVPFYSPQNATKSNGYVSVGKEYASNSGAFAPASLRLVSRYLDADEALSPLTQARMAADPRYAAWWKANRESVDKARSAISKPFEGLSEKDQIISGYYAGNPLLEGLAADIYHNNMYNLTNGTGQVSAPVKSK